MKVAVRYVSPASAYSGYGEASRTFISALSLVGVDLTTQILAYDNNLGNYFGQGYKTSKGLENRTIPYDIKIIHIPCESYIRHLEPCKFHIGHLFWETDRMSPEWAWNCNLMDEIWTGSESNKRAFERSGVRVPIWVFPETVDSEMASKEYKKLKVRYGGSIFNNEEFLFFSTFQWIERKNPKALVTAYLKEFNADEKVGLLIKTYKDKFTISEKKEISSQIWQWKKEVGTANHPPIYLSVELLDKPDVSRVYTTGDCFVLPHRGEGWGRCTHEAMLFGKPVIATSAGGIHDWLPKETYYPLTPIETNVFGMEWAPWYRKDQKWADVGIGELRKHMRQVFEDQDGAVKVGKRGQEFVKNSFSYEAVGRIMKDRLIDIQKQINTDKRKGIKFLGEVIK